MHYPSNNLDMTDALHFVLFQMLEGADMPVCGMGLFWST